LLPAFVAVGPAGEPQHGTRYMLQRVGPELFVATLRADALEIRGLTASGATRHYVLEPAPSRPRCFGDGKALLELVDL
jgi:hypothetical protein